MARCANCGADNPAEGRFCRSCGNSLPAPSGTGEEPVAAAPTASFDISRIATRPGAIAIALASIIGFIIIVWAAAGIYTVSPGEQAVLRLFGQVQQPPTDELGLHWWWPGPIGKMDVVIVKQVRRLELGFRSAAGPNIGVATVPVEARMITGDLNIVVVQMVVQYEIKNLTDFLFRVDDPGEQTGFNRNIAPGRPDGRTLKDAAEAALSLVVGQHSMPDVLADQRPEVEADTKVMLQGILDQYQTGINIVSVLLRNVQAPEEVLSAFDDVLRARQEKVTRISKALEAANSTIPQAHADAERLITQAEDSRPVWDIQAQEQAEQFVAILRGYGTEQDVTRQQLYLEAMDELLPGVGKFITSLGQEN